MALVRAIVYDLRNVVVSDSDMQVSKERTVNAGSTAMFASNKRSTPPVHTVTSQTNTP